MALLRELRVQTNIIKWLKRNYDRIYVNKINDRNRSGTLDIWTIYKGVTVILEVKTDDGKLDLIQKKEIAKIQRAGAYAFEVRNTNEVKKIMKGIFPNG